MKKYIHVNQHVIRHNKKYNNALPACRVQTGIKSQYCKEVIIEGPSKLVYNPDNPLPCGAKLWIETTSKVTLVDETPYKDIKEVMEHIVSNNVPPQQPSSY